MNTKFQLKNPNGMRLMGIDANTVFVCLYLIIVSGAVIGYEMSGGKMLLNNELEMCKRKCSGVYHGIDWKD